LLFAVLDDKYDVKYDEEGNWKNSGKGDWTDRLELLLFVVLDGTDDGKGGGTGDEKHGK
jgi:hypothetical protein